jgi:hypothetical protein
LFPCYDILPIAHILSIFSVLSLAVDISASEILIGGKKRTPERGDVLLCRSLQQSPSLPRPPNPAPSLPRRPVVNSSSQPLHCIGRNWSPCHGITLIDGLC